MRGQNKVIIVRAIEEYLIGQCEEVFREFYAPDCVAAGPDVAACGDGTPIPMDCVAFRDHSLMYKSAFPDMEFQVEDIVEEGDRVAARWTVRGSDCGNSEAISLRERLSPGDADFCTSGVVFCRLNQGKIVEIWQMSNLVSLLKLRNFDVVAQDAVV
tara:strand:- start:1111 stop:1581 length:471 start_codon:yes stop_codon:yes gene_type:complete